MYSFYTQPQKHISNAKIIFPEWGAPLESYLSTYPKYKYYTSLDATDMSLLHYYCDYLRPHGSLYSARLCTNFQ